MTQHALRKKPEGPSAPARCAAGGTSTKSLGVTCAFFGMLFVIGAIAALASGRLNPHIPAQALRGGLTLGLGLASFLISMVLLKRARCRRM